MQSRPRLSSEEDSQVKFQFFIDDTSIYRLAIDGAVDRLCPPTSTATIQSCYLYIAVHLYEGFGKQLQDLRPLCSNHKTTLLAQYSSEESPHFWFGETLSFPVRYKELPRNATLLFAVYGITGPQEKILHAIHTVTLFDEHGVLRTGHHELALELRPEGSTQIQPGWAFEQSAMEEVIEEACRWKSKFTWGVTKSTVCQKQESSSQIAKLRQLIHRNVTLHAHFPDEYMIFHQEGSGQVFRTLRRKHWSVDDPEIGKANPCEAKYNTLTNARSTLDDPNLRPNSDEIAMLNEILRYPPTRHLKQSEKDIIWKFRVYLSRNKRALTKFLKSVEWTQSAQAKVACGQLLPKWERPDVKDALELLSSTFAKLDKVRTYAIQECLVATPDEDLRYYLLQLVQALRYDPPKKDSLLLKFLAERCSKNFTIASYVYWYLRVEEKDPKDYALFQKRMQEFNSMLQSLNPSTLELFEAQSWLLKKLKDLSILMKTSGLDRLGQKSLAHRVITDTLTSFDTVCLPLNPEIQVTGLQPDIHIFRSAMAPVKLDLSRKGGGYYSVIYKTGDDLRQDQLVLQLILLFDRLLKHENLDLKFVPYNVLATSRYDGLLECVPESMNLATILSEYNGDIQKFLRKFNPDPKAPYGITPVALDNFIRSTAGYAIATYVLGIGDRHLDNLLLSKSGHCFHIDFGFILGRDPKGFVSPMRLTQAMVDGMGGDQSQDYRRFASHCAEAFNILRKSSNLILNLVSLMIDANIEQIAGDKDLLEIEKRLLLDLTDEQAALKVEQFLTDSVNALGPKIAETLHNLRKIYN